MTSIFNKGIYIVILGYVGGSKINENSFPSNYIFKQRVDDVYLLPEVDACGSRSNGWSSVRADKTSTNVVWRLASGEEIRKYNEFNRYHLKSAVNIDWILPLDHHVSSIYDHHNISLKSFIDHGSIIINKESSALSELQEVMIAGFKPHKVEIDEMKKSSPNNEEIGKRLEKFRSKVKKIYDIQHQEPITFKKPKASKLICI